MFCLTTTYLNQFYECLVILIENRGMSLSNKGLTVLNTCDIVHIHVYIFSKAFKRYSESFKQYIRSLKLVSISNSYLN